MKLSAILLNVLSNDAYFTAAIVYKMFEEPYKYGVFCTPYFLDEAYS